MGGLPAHHLWWLAAVLLLAMEVVFSGYFLLWIAIGAAATGLLSACWPSLGWAGQVAGFVVLAFAACGFYARWRARRHGPRSAMLLNRRGEQMLGRDGVLAEAIVQGRGRMRIGDSLWPVQGPDLPAGTRVRVTAVQGIMLQVVPATGTASPDVS